jgi:hypothetical protein
LDAGELDLAQLLEVFDGGGDDVAVAFVVVVLEPRQVLGEVVDLAGEQLSQVPDVAVERGGGQQRRVRDGDVAPQGLVALVGRRRLMALGHGGPRSLCWWSSPSRREGGWPGDGPVRAESPMD